MLGGVVRAGLFPDGPLYRWMDFGLYTFHMPLFFLLAGLNVPHSLRRGRGPFLKAKGWTVAYPYVLWSLIQGGITVVLARDANMPITGSDLAAIWYRPIAQFWFLYALMICHILAVLVRPAVLAGLAAAGLLGFVLLPQRTDLSLTLHDLPFYVAGVFAAGRAAAWRGPGWAVLPAVLAAFAAAVVAAGSFGMDSAGLAALPACVLGIVGVVSFSLVLARRPPRFLMAAGMMSMTIYVLHILAGSGTRLVLQRLHVPAWPWFYLVGATAAGVLLPMVAHRVLARLHGLAPLGLAPWRRLQSGARTA